MADITNKTNYREGKEYAITKMPSFEGKKALILGGAFYGDIVRLFAEAGFDRANNVDEADLIVFAGGVDVDPALYGAEKHPMTQHPNRDRDSYEKGVYEEAKAKGKFMYGICRGAQFLHVMNGGELWQHVEGHAMGDHWIYDCEDDLYVKATSYHHQMLALNQTMDVLAVCPEQISHTFESDTFKLKIPKGETEIEIEAGYYKDTKALFVQGHPEVGSKEYRSWCMSSLHDFMEGLYFDERPAEEGLDTVDVETQIEMWRAAALM